MSYIDVNIAKYENTLVEDCNTEATETNMQEFVESYFLVNVVKIIMFQKSSETYMYSPDNNKNLKCFAMLKHMKQAYQIFID